MNQIGISERFQRAIERIDDENRQDPNVEEADGELVPKELLYGQRMTSRLESFQPDASEALRLAVRCQHIRRWQIPRSTYPMDRMGYRRWRSELSAFHGGEAARILSEVGYDQDTIERVRSLVMKRRLKKDDEAQTLEDVACLVFLEHYLEEFAKAHDEEKLISILQKTWLKMSEHGRDAALQLPLSAEIRKLIVSATESHS